MMSMAFLRFSFVLVPLAFFLIPTSLCVSQAYLEKRANNETTQRLGEIEDVRTLQQVNDPWIWSSGGEYTVEFGKYSEPHLPWRAVDYMYQFCLKVLIEDVCSSTKVDFSCFSH